VSAVAIAHLLILIGTLVIILCSSALLRNVWDRLAVFVFATGFYMFSGIGIALEHVFFGWDFICYYFLFLFCFCVSYALCSQAMRTLSDYTGRVLEAAATDMDSSSFWAAIPYIYIFLHVIPLLYPNFILFRVMPGCVRDTNIWPKWRDLINSARLPRASDLMSSPDSQPAGSQYER